MRCLLDGVAVGDVLVRFSASSLLLSSCALTPPWSPRESPPNDLAHVETNPREVQTR